MDFVDVWPVRAISTITTEVSTPTWGTYVPEMSHKVLSSKPSTVSFSRPTTKTFQRFRVHFTTAKRLQSNLYSLNEITSSILSDLGFMVAIGVTVRGSTIV